VSNGRDLAALAFGVRTGGDRLDYGIAVEGLLARQLAGT
jgi:hypothetical protein